MEKDITIGKKYDPAMKIMDQDLADAYFEECVLHTMTFGRTRQEAESIERQNLGYYAGYFDDETRARVERLFKCAHPIFGSIAANGNPSPKQAFELGKGMAKKS